MYSYTLIQSLSGDGKSAVEFLSSELVMKVIFLDRILKEKPCGINQKVLNKIYPMLRVIAAVHENTPIDALSENETALQVLQKAIQENTDHYKETIAISKSWVGDVK